MASSDDKLKKQIWEKIEKALPEKILIHLEEEGLIEEEEFESLWERRCSKGEQLKCREDERRRLIFEFMKKGYFNEKFRKSKDFPWSIRKSGKG